MRFWDSSAVVPLIVEEARSRSCRSLLRQDPSLAVWAFTSTEVASTLHRLRREGHLEPSGLTRAVGRLGLLARQWTEVEAFGAVRERAERLLSVHALTSADAHQLGAALVLVGERPRGRWFVTADARLAGAAEGEGFRVHLPG
ncbi:MAG TPA: type II toxin-antitoxin system VapC family toxin [Myxococcaceae bacterium]|nr:type II toxin-antitoxin system VapC family toxin [Myxococcaceae bacterium]